MTQDMKDKLAFAASAGSLWLMGYGCGTGHFWMVALGAATILILGAMR